MVYLPFLVCCLYSFRAATTVIIKNRLLSIIKIIGNESDYRLVAPALCARETISQSRRLSVVNLNTSPFKLISVDKRWKTAEDTEWAAAGKVGYTRLLCIYKRFKQKHRLPPGALSCFDRCVWDLIPLTRFLSAYILIYKC